MAIAMTAARSAHAVQPGASDAATAAETTIPAIRSGTAQSRPLTTKYPRASGGRRCVGSGVDASVRPPATRPGTASFASAGPVSARKPSSTSSNALGRSAIGT